MTNIAEGMYVRWRAERYLNSWDIYGKIVKVSTTDITTSITIFGFDDMGETTININTFNNECIIVSREEALLYLYKVILNKREELLHKEKEVFELRNNIIKFEIVKDSF